MDAKKAVEKIEEINVILQSSNRVLFSWKFFMMCGLFCFFAPLIGYFTQWLTFGHDFGPYQLVYIPLANCFVYWGLAMGLSKVFPPKPDKFEKVSLNPLIEKAFSIVRPASVSMAGIVIVLSLMGQWKFIYPIIFIILGIMYYIFGKFSIPVVSYFAWSFIGAGLLFIYLRSFDNPYLDLYFVGFQGLSFLTMGFFLIREEKTHAR